MPHCILEYSHNLEQEIAPVDLMDAVREACVESDLFAPEDIKVRSSAYKSFMLPGQEDAFIHVTLRVLSGRTPSQKKQLTESVLASLVNFSLSNVSISVELCDIERESYAKKVIVS